MKEKTVVITRNEMVWDGQKNVLKFKRDLRDIPIYNFPENTGAPLPEVSLTPRMDEAMEIQDHTFDSLEAILNRLYDTGCDLEKKLVSAEVASESWTMIAGSLQNQIKDRDIALEKVLDFLDLLNSDRVPVLSLYVKESAEEVRSFINHQRKNSPRPTENEATSTEKP